MLSIGALIWISCRPLIRLILTASCGFLITKADIFPPVAARGTGQIILNIALPCLMFSKVVPSFNSTNISALGPLVLVSFLYQGIGMLMGWVIRQIFWVPHRFRYGILVAGGWGNYGDIPTSVIMSLTSAAPFNPNTDQDLAIAYCAAFILIFFITLFPLGGQRLVALDWVGPEVEDDEVREVIRLKRKAILTGWTHPIQKFISHCHPHIDDGSDVETASPMPNEKADMADSKEEPNILVEELQLQSPGAHLRNQKHVSFFQDEATTVAPTEAMSHVCSPAATDIIQSCVTTPAPSVTQVSSSHPRFDTNKESHHHQAPESQRSQRSGTKLIVKRVNEFLHNLMNPASIAIIVAFIISLVPPLKALFVPGVPNTRIPNAPDGQPPLAFVMDLASFIGAGSVPLSLICLGSALARLKIPQTWTSLPIGAILALAVGKVVISPVLGVLICQGLVSAGLIDASNKVLRFVIIFFSCLPTATTQVFLTQVYSSTGSAEHLSAFLIPQYILMFFSMIVLTAYSLNLLF